MLRLERKLRREVSVAAIFFEPRVEIKCTLSSNFDVSTCRFFICVRSEGYFEAYDV